MALNKIRTGLAICLIGVSSVGCTHQTPQARLKSPIELMHNLAFGRGGLTTSEYVGSPKAREWAMAEHAESMARQQQQFAASLAAKQQ